MKGFGKARVGAALVGAGALLSFASAAHAQRPASLGTGSPVGQMGVQLYDWSQYIQQAAAPGELNPPAPTTVDGRLERVFQFLQSRGIKNVELYGYAGIFPGNNPATPNNTAALQALRTLGDQYGLKFISRHGGFNEANWDNDIAASKLLGQEYIGAADAPGGYNQSYSNTLAAAALMNRLGKRSVEAGLGPVYFHNHAHEFQTKWLDNGVLKSAEEIMLDRTDPRYVKAQVDIFWALSGGADVPAFLNKYGNRVISFHVKDGNVRPGAGTGDLRELGKGTVDFAPIFAAAKNRVKYYLYEYDPVGIGNNGGFNPFTSADTSFAALKGDPAPTLSAANPTFTSVPAGTAAASNTTPVVVTNVGDAPLTITNSAIQQDPGDAPSSSDFLVVSQNCYGTGTSPLAPGGTCTLNVGFKPTRTNTVSVARLQITSTSDDATESIPLIAKSTGDAVSTVGGDVPSVLTLSLGGTASFGTFVPGAGRPYETALAATVTTTTGDAALSVSDPSLSAPGHLVNGAFALPSPLNARAGNSANPSPAYAPLAEATGTPTQLLSYAAPTTSDVVTVGLRQTIGAGDALRSGTYSKTLTFTLSSTTP